MKSISAIFARNVRIYRELQGLTQAQLAEHVEISVNFLSLIEVERKFPSPQVVDRFIRALRLKPHQLFQDSFDLEAVTDQTMAHRFAVDFRDGVTKNLHEYIDKFFESR